MSRSFSPSPRRQRGDVLMESLIGLVLMSVIGLGVTYATSRTLVSQRDMNVQNLAVAQMRNLLQQYGTTLCPGPGGTNTAKAVLNLPTAVSSSTLNLDVTCSPAPTVVVQGVIVTIDSSQTVPLKNVVLSTQETNRTLFSGIIKVGDQT